MSSTRACRPVGQTHTSVSQFVGGGAHIADAVAAKTAAMTPMPEGDSSMVAVHVHVHVHRYYITSSLGRVRRSKVTRSLLHSMVQDRMPARCFVLLCPTERAQRNCTRLGILTQLEVSQAPVLPKDQLLQWFNSEFNTMVGAASHLHRSHSATLEHSGLPPRYSRTARSWCGLARSEASRVQYASAPTLRRM